MPTKVRALGRRYGAAGEPGEKGRLHATRTGTVDGTVEVRRCCSVGTVLECSSRQTERSPVPP
eukprot:4693430-Pleurochrysis_carterae.AAC.1